jgi:eukaryotic-like serine/threonine-protein kinase
MPLNPGDRVGSAQVITRIGSGGMGEVWLARDARLHRDVAIKILPEAWIGDPDRVRRFEREARMLAALNHPNIALIYGVEEHRTSASPGKPPIRALVMEYVDGPTLAEMIARRAEQALSVHTIGALAPAEALTIAGQIAEALEASHEAGIIHRDLKPANVKVRTDGTVKVLDFGLAKDVAEPEGGPLLANSPTALSPVTTQDGTILGTVAYMSPEQARGRAIDKRADIWAFGCVLYEMLTGRPPFAGDSLADTLSAITRDEPDWSLLPPTVGTATRALIAGCLEKNPRERLRDIGDGRHVLKRAEAEGDTVESGRRLPHDQRAFAFTVPLRPGYWIPMDEPPVLALSGTGELLVFVAVSREGRQLFRRDLAKLTASPIAGTDGAAGPFLSPDAQWVGFFAGGLLKKVPAAGGNPTAICEVTGQPRGAVWTLDHRIVLSPASVSPLMWVPDTGGVAKPLTDLRPDHDERSHRWPTLAADGRSVLFTIGLGRSAQDYDECDIAQVSLDTGAVRVVFRGARTVRAAGGSEMLLQRRNTLLRAPLPRPGAPAAVASRTLLEGVAGDASSGSGYVAVGGGVLAYAPTTTVAERANLFRVDRAGRSTKLPGGTRGYRYPRVSPDGRQIVFSVTDDRDVDVWGTRADLWSFDLTTERLSRLTVGSASTYPCWHPDGRRVAFFRTSQPSGVYEKPVDGGRTETPLWVGTAGNSRLADSWHPAGGAIAVANVERVVGLWLVPCDGSGEPRPVGDGEERWGAAFSPDGAYLAYTAVTAGVADVFVEALSGNQARWQVSTEGGMFPVWSRDGKELVYLSGDDMMAVDVELGPSIRFGVPRTLFRSPFDLRTPPTRNFDLLPDGSVIMIGRSTEGADGGELCVMTLPE